MADSLELAERVLDVLRPFASNWNGSLRRGDLVIPQGDVSRIASQIVDVIADVLGPGNEVDDHALFLALRDLERLPALQDRAAALKRRFRVAPRRAGS